MSTWRKLVRKRELWVPTRWGWLLLVAAGVLVTSVMLTQVYPFLAVTDVNRSGPVVVEGWSGYIVIRAAVAEYRMHDYPALLFTGGPIEQESILHEQGSYAQLGASLAKRIGLPADAAQAIPAVPVIRDRTFAEALALKRWFAAQGAPPVNLTVVASACHARRSRLLFQKAFGPAVRVGVLAVYEGGYDPKRWWSSSAGFREVTTEVIAYTYARLLFWRTPE